jgi:hypothetical protein
MLRRPEKKLRILFLSTRFSAIFIARAHYSSDFRARNSRRVHGRLSQSSKPSRNDSIAVWEVALNLAVTRPKPHETGRQLIRTVSQVAETRQRRTFCVTRGSIFLAKDGLPGSPAMTPIVTQ